MNVPISETGDGHQGNQSGAPALQEDVDDHDHQGEGNTQRQNDFVNARRDGLGGVERHIVFHAGGEVGRQFLQPFVYTLRRGDGIRSGKLVDGHDAGGRAVIARREVVYLGSEFHPRHIAQMEGRSHRDWRE